MASIAKLKKSSFAEIDKVENRGIPADQESGAAWFPIGSTNVECQPDERAGPRC
jgi:hypothetical protein